MKIARAAVVGVVAACWILVPGTSFAGAAQTKKTTSSKRSVIGCVMREADYRKAHGKGKGGALGTGLGLNDEYVLVHAVRSPQDIEKSPVVATSGKTTNYALSGHFEEKFATSVSRQVEIVGTLNGKNGSLPRLVVTDWHTVADFCPADAKN